MPNKEFITGRLLNWSLSDQVTRLMITDGAAYGTDIEKAHTLMQAAAKEHEGETHRGDESSINEWVSCRVTIGVNSIRSGRTRPAHATFKQQEMGNENHQMGGPWLEEVH